MAGRLTHERTLLLPWQYLILAFYLINRVNFTYFVVYATYDLDYFHCNVLGFIWRKRKHNIIITFSKCILLTKSFSKIKSRLINSRLIDSRLINCAIFIYGTIAWDNISFIGRLRFSLYNNANSDIGGIIAINSNIEIVVNFLFCKSKSIHKADSDIFLLKCVIKFHILPSLIRSAKYSCIATNNC